MSLAEDLNCAAQLPLYNCHKQVWALKIKSITLASPPTIADLEKVLNGITSGEGEIVGATIEPEEDGYASFPVSREYVVKHNPQVGGYYVVYNDGYTSYSPAKAFEEGYTRA